MEITEITSPILYPPVENPPMAKRYPAISKSSTSESYQLATGRNGKRSSIIWSIHKEHLMNFDRIYSEDEF